MSLRPDYFTTREGGDWQSWTETWTEHDIPDLTRRDPDFVIVAREKVHALAFGSPMAGAGYFIRWDCISGFNQRAPLNPVRPTGE